MKYTIKIKSHEQDNLNFIPFVDKMPSYIDYEKVLAYSIEKGYIQNESEIETLVDGSDNVQSYFTRMSAAEDCKATLEADYDTEFDAEVSEYEVF